MDNDELWDKQRRRWLDRATSGAKFVGGLSLNLVGALVWILTMYMIEVEHKPKHVLFLVADDMRPEISSYLGPYFPATVHPDMHTPNIDKLASKSLLLKRAYCQQALCSPSRASALTGRRPDTTHVYDLKSYFRKVGGNFVTIPQYFKQHGYRSIGLGKIFHPKEASGFDDPVSWTEPYFHAPNKKFYRGKRASWYSVSDAQRRDKPLPDDQIADRAIQWIRQIASEPEEERQPFFLAVGLHKPHLPFVFPEEFLQYYPMESIRLPDNDFAPDKMPKLAWSDYSELRSFDDIGRLHASGDINTTLPQNVVLELRRAYYAALRYADHLLGTVLDALEESGLAKDTVVAFWSDHGYQLGEHGEWTKHTNFELAAHSPMMIRVPGKTDHGIESEELTELVDLFPTLVDAVDLPKLPLCPEEGASEVEVCTEGQSVMPLINPDFNAKEMWKDRVFFQFRRGGGNKKIMGYSMRTDRYHYTEWVGFTGEPEYKPKWDLVYALELYDHHLDPRENRNVANEASYRAVQEDLHNKLLAGWRAAYVTI